MTDLTSSETLQAKPRADIISFFILHDFWIIGESIRKLERSRENSGMKEEALREVKSNLITLYKKVRPHFIKNDKAKGWYEAVRLAKTYEELEGPIDAIQDYLWNDLKITKADNYKNYDRTNVENENRDKGL